MLSDVCGADTDCAYPDSYDRSMHQRFFNRSHLDNRDRGHVASLNRPFVDLARAFVPQKQYVGTAGEFSATQFLINVAVKRFEYSRP